MRLTRRQLPGLGGKWAMTRARPFELRLVRTTGCRKPIGMVGLPPEPEVGLIAGPSTGLPNA